MIDDHLTLPPAVLDAARAGDTAALTDALAADAADPARAQELAALAHRPALVVELVSATPQVTLRQRALLGEAAGLLHADGDDRDTAHTVVLASTPTELLHVMLAGVRLAPRRTHPVERVVAQPAVELPEAESVLELVRGTRPLPDGVEPAVDADAYRWWGLRWYEPDAPEVAAWLHVLDVGRYWVQDGRRLHPADPVGLFLALAPLLGVCSELGYREPAPDDDLGWPLGPRDAGLVAAEADEAVVSRPPSSSGGTGP